ncbi:hypothetical protein Pmani_028266 [Petrolisthes manimaculis]|uniref:Uncharacterized protein n=1 Tax=Petrolisthes manimaculis TaxID=1843537 RepID=A0AAE1P134_9EUCA|nr:hypothetical protein Pmani_028266 [Petrolisthes manimaculis]
MATLDNADTARALAPGEINKMTNPQLKKALATLINTDASQQPSNNDLLDEIKSLKADDRGMAGIKQKLDQLTERLDQAYNIISQQQFFMESLDNKERRNNLIITGVSEAVDEIDRTDVEKVRNVITETGYQLTSDPATWEIRRLGRENERRKRPLLVVVGDGHQRNEILKKARNLKSAQGLMASVYIKKDVHPAVRKEMARLRQREKEEKDKPENVGVNLVYDWKRRVLLKD